MCIPQCMHVRRPCVCNMCTRRQTEVFNCADFCQIFGGGNKLLHRPCWPQCVIFACLGHALVFCFCIANDTGVKFSGLVGYLFFHATRAGHRAKKVHDFRFLCQNHVCMKINTPFWQSFANVCSPRMDVQCTAHCRHIEVPNVKGLHVVATCMLSTK